MSHLTRDHSSLPNTLSAEKFEQGSVPVGIFYFASWQGENALLYNNQYRASRVQTRQGQGIILGEQEDARGCQRTCLASRSSIERPVLIDVRSLPETCVLGEPAQFQFKTLPCIGLREDGWMRYAPQTGVLEVGTVFHALETNTEFDKRILPEQEEIPAIKKFQEQYPRSLLILDSSKRELLIFTLTGAGEKSLSIPFFAIAGKSSKFSSP